MVEPLIIFIDNPTVDCIEHVNERDIIVSVRPQEYDTSPVSLGFTNMDAMRKFGRRIIEIANRKETNDE